MAKTLRLLKVPFYIIAYSTSRLFSVSDDKNIFILPVFPDAEAAEKYRQYFARTFKLKLQLCVVDKAEKGLNLIQCASISCPSLRYIAINPSPPKIGAARTELKTIQTLIRSLQNQCQKVHNHQNPHKKRDSEV